MSVKRSGGGVRFDLKGRIYEVEWNEGDGGEEGSGFVAGVVSVGGEEGRVVSGVRGGCVGVLKEVAGGLEKVVGNGGEGGVWRDSEEEDGDFRMRKKVKVDKKVELVMGAQGGKVGKVGKLKGKASSVRKKKS